MEFRALQNCLQSQTTAKAVIHAFVKNYRALFAIKYEYS